MKDKYIIVTVEWPKSTKQLQEKVNERIAEGYIPVGGLVVWKDNVRGRYMAQSMVLNESR